jgi:hypothetical protein
VKKAILAIQDLPGHPDRKGPKGIPERRDLPGRLDRLGRLDLRVLKGIPANVGLRVNAVHRVRPDLLDHLGLPVHRVSVDLKVNAVHRVRPDLLVLLDHKDLLALRVLKVLLGSVIALKDGYGAKLAASPRLFVTATSPGFCQHFSTVISVLIAIGLAKRLRGGALEPGLLQNAPLALCWRHASTAPANSTRGQIPRQRHLEG